MYHYCQCALITCEDFRLHERIDGRNYVAEFVKSLGVDCDIITRGGAIQDLTRPKQTGFANSIWRDLEVSVKLHNIKEIYLINHTNCGAYSYFNFTDLNQELKQHQADLQAAKQAIQQRYPDLKVKLLIFKLQPGTTDKFETVVVI